VLIWDAFASIFLADLSHLASILILLHKIQTSRSCRGGCFLLPFGCGWVAGKVELWTEGRGYSFSSRGRTIPVSHFPLPIDENPQLTHLFHHRDIIQNPSTLRRRFRLAIPRPLSR
jgi:hypothetical protein